MERSYDIHGNRINYSERFINVLLSDIRFNREISYINERFNYGIFINDEEGELRKELFIESLEYYESYKEFPFVYDGDTYSIIIYYGED